MSDCTHHAKSSARRFGGEPGDYVSLHLWFDESKGHMGDFRHRALRHHTMGILEAIDTFGPWLVRESDGKKVSTRLLCEQHLMEDCGFLPTVADWLGNLNATPWMMNAARKLSKEFADA